MNTQSWDEIFLITNPFGKDNFTSSDPKVSLIFIDSLAEPVALVEYIKKELKGKISDFEIG